MTVSYTADVANASRFGCFTKILLRWKGSVYKLILKELVAYVILYFLLNAFYRHVLVVRQDWESQRHFFEALKAYCSMKISSIPMTFVLGFYVNLIVKRWWDQYRLLPWPDSLAIFIVAMLQGTDERARLMRRNIMRHVLSSYVITLRRISCRVLRRFPTMEHLSDAGFMNPDELKLMEKLNEKCSVAKWWMPLAWAATIVQQARSEQKIASDPGMQTIMNEISNIRNGLTGVQHYDTISVPLVYTQVVTWSVYTYFIAALMGAQWVTPKSSKVYENIYHLPTFQSMSNSSSSTQTSYMDVNYEYLDLYMPVFLILQFVFYVGWLKVAETLINPFGEDDDDFELNYLIDRHTQVAYMIVDEMQQESKCEPLPLVKDKFWAGSRVDLPYTEETAHYRREEPKGSAELKDEADNASSTYYKITFPFRRFSMARKSHVAPDANGCGSHCSEYESIDPGLFSQGRWTKKSRKSSTTIHHEPIERRRKVSEGSKSLKSQRSIYSKMFKSIHNPRSMRVGNNNVSIDEKLDMTDHELNAKMDSHEVDNHSVSAAVASLIRRSMENMAKEGVVVISDSENDEHEDNESIDHQQSEAGVSGGALSSSSEPSCGQLTHLSTILEGNSPYSTKGPGSRRGSRVPLDQLFENNMINLERFVVQEVPNYEPVIVEMAEEEGQDKQSNSESPALPKRQAVLSLHDSLLVQQQQQRRQNFQVWPQNDQDRRQTDLNDTTFYV